MSIKLEKLKSGSYRARKTYKGVTYRVTFDYKPTQKEIMQALAAEMDKAQGMKQRMTFLTAAEKYNDSKSNILSPSTIKGYSAIINSISPKFKAMLLSDVTAEIVQKEINAYSKDHSPKTVKNMHGYISAVLSLYSPNTRLFTTLPKNNKKEEYIPVDGDIQAILEAVKGTKYEVPFWLGTLGLRRSEICALTLDDISENQITICKAKVQDKNNCWIIKPMTKSEDGMRTITVPGFIIDLILRQGYVYKGYPNMLLKHLHKIQEQLEIPRFSFHKLRHYYASMAHSIGIPDSYIMAAGGWKSDGVMKTVYRHALKDRQKDMESKAVSYMENNLATNLATKIEKARI